MEIDALQEERTASEEERLAEAARRLEYLTEKGLHGNVLSEWKASGKKLLYYSDAVMTPFGVRPVLYWVGNRPEYLEAVERFEEEFSATVYHCILSHTELGDMLAMLYVTSQKEEWAMDWDDLRAGHAVANVANLDDPALSDIGGIGVEVDEMFGGLVRTY